MLIRQKYSFSFLLLTTMLVCATYFVSYAEGTKQIRPTIADIGNLEINDQSRPFALESNTDSLHRLYFHIADTSENVYLGFNHQGGGSATFRIKDPVGNVVHNRTSIPSSGTGFIKNYNEAVVGPQINGLPSTGYAPFEFTPTTTGDFYIEFTTTLSGTYHFDLFDITVTDTDDNPIEGRLWSYAWDLSTRSFSGRYNGAFFIYTDDRYVSKIEMNGIQPYGFVVACNATGPGNTPGMVSENRKSIEGNSTRPQFKVFLNDPDPNVYPSGELPTIVSNLHVVGGQPTYGEPSFFSLNISQPGTVQIILDINDTPGYQENSEDVALVKELNAGGDTIEWDSKDGFGEFVNNDVQISVSSSFSTGVTHLPLYDPETHENGYIVERIRPAQGLTNLYWDDSNFEDGTLNIDNTNPGGHDFPYFFGDVRTMNTWWNGYELDNLNSFSFDFAAPLPVELISFSATPDKNKVILKWKTASEINNSHFIIEKSYNAYHFSPIGNINGAGNSNQPIHYIFEDYSTDSAIVYYRLKQVDYDGQYDYSNIVSVTKKDYKDEMDIVLQNNQYSLKICCKNETSLSLYIVEAASGRVIKQEEQQVPKGETYISLNEIIFQPGIYCITTKTKSNFFSKLIPF